jgi:protein-S-isoprenylcysteine O-methyltransferase Ste14
MADDVPDTARGYRLGRADVLVAAQLLSAAGLLWPGRSRWRLPRPVTAGCLAAAAGGAVLAGEAVRVLGRDLTPFVEPRTGARLATDGPFAVSRNPVYAGMLIGGAGVAVLRRRPEPLVAFAVLAAVLHVKAGVEELRLRARFGARYDAYAARTPRLVGLVRPAVRPAVRPSVRPGAGGRWPAPGGPAG